MDLLCSRFMITKRRTVQTCRYLRELGGTKDFAETQENMRNCTFSNLGTLFNNLAYFINHERTSLIIRLLYSNYLLEFLNSNS